MTPVRKTEKRFLIKSDIYFIYTPFSQPGVERPEAAYTFERQDLLQMTVDLFRKWINEDWGFGVT